MTRGPSGTIRGLPAATASRLMAAFHKAVGGASFQPREAKSFFQDECGMSEAVADALVIHYLRLPGVEQEREGLWRSGPEVRAQMEHRTWRFPSGRLDLAGAEWLAAAIKAKREGGEQAPPESILALEARLVRGLQSLEEAEDA